jgi:WD40 repeat protein
VPKGHTEVATSLAVLTDGRIVSGSSGTDNNVCIWYPETGMCDVVLEGHEHGVLFLAALRDGRIASGSQDGVIRMWQRESWKCDVVLAATYCHGEIFSGGEFAALPDGRIASGTHSGIVRIWDPESGNCNVVLEGNDGILFCVIWHCT